MDDMRTALETVFRRLPVQKQNLLFLKDAVEMLMITAEIKPNSALFPANFTIIGRTRTKGELIKLSRSDSNPVEDLAHLHQTTILALAMHGYCRGDDVTPDSIRATAKRASLSDLGWIPINVAGGKPKNVRAHAITTMLAYHYERLTGKAPGRVVDGAGKDFTPYGPFVELVTSVFEIFSLGIDTEDIVKMVCRKYKAAKKTIA